MARVTPADAARGPDDPRRLTYAPERGGAPAPASRLGPVLDPAVFPWEELARIRGRGDAEPARADPAASAPRTPPDPASMNAAPGPPVRGDAATTLPTAPAVSPTAASFGWTLTAVGGRRPAREVPAADHRWNAWKWMFWVALVAFALYLL